MLRYILSRCSLQRFFLNIYLFIQREREREREAETQAEGEAGSMQGAQRGTGSQVSRITPRAAGGAKPLRHWGCPCRGFLLWIKMDVILY